MRVLYLWDYKKSERVRWGYVGNDNMLALNAVVHNFGNWERIITSKHWENDEVDFIDNKSGLYAGWIVKE